MKKNSYGFVISYNGMPLHSFIEDQRFKIKINKEKKRGSVENVMLAVECGPKPTKEPQVRLRHGPMLFHAALWIACCVICLAALLVHFLL